MELYRKTFCVVLAILVLAAILCGCFDETTFKNKLLQSSSASSSENSSMVVNNSSKTVSNVKKPKEIKEGNLAGNLINNGGFATYQDGWIYYAASEGIFKVSNDGTEEQMIYPYPSWKLSASELNVYGNWLYFQLSNIMGKDKYVRIKTDGSMGSSFQTAYEDINGFQIVNNYIYYVSLNDGALHRANLDKSNDKVLITNSKLKYGFQITENKIYFGDNIDVYEANLDGTNLKCYKDAGSQDMLIYKGKKYTSGGLSCENVDGLNKIKYLNGGGSNIVIKDDWIYYINNETDDFKSPELIYRMKIDGTNKQQLNDSYTMAINVVGDWIYYKGANMTFHDDGTASGHSEGLYRMKLDGSQKTKIE